MALGKHPEALACLIVAHNLGDAVIQSDFLRSLVAGNYAGGYLVWTRPQVAFLFEGLPNCRIVCSQFPVGTNKQFGGRAFLQFCRAAWKLRRLKPTVTIDLIGDVRDRMFGRLIGGRKHVHIGWAQDHPFSRLIRNPFGPGKPTIVIPADISNVYDAHRMLMTCLVPAPKNTAPLTVKSRPRRVGVHPFASQSCKLWPEENWRQLVASLSNDADMEITAFGAPNERGALESLFGSFGDRVKLVTVGLPEFARQVAELDLMIGLDSFSVHMAHRQRVRSILINGGNPEGLWATPTGKTLSSSGGCRFYPCFNIPKCEKTSFENACVKSITVADVENAIHHTGVH